jgi:NAD(P)-dependent dehydrogenase (short-subunit alcohol dehydrogenase family)
MRLPGSSQRAETQCLESRFPGDEVWAAGEMWLLALGAAFELVIRAYGGGAWPLDRGVGRYGKVEGIASAVSFLANPEQAFINGESLTVDGGWNA